MTKTKMPHALGMGAEIIHVAKRLKVPDQIKVLGALAEIGSAWNDEPLYANFKYLVCECLMTRARVRFVVRALARKGLASFGKGLFNEDGMPAGSGYAITPKGIAVYNIIRSDNED